MPLYGNPNVYTIYRGRYEVTAPDGLQHICMLTNVNDVVFCGNYTSDNTGLICTLPTELRPESEILLPAYTSEGYLVSVGINSDGTVWCNRPSQLIYLRGLSFNISCNYYAGE